MGAILLLEDGRRFVGEGFGASTTKVGEAVFNTAMTGYQEVLTDPSYAEQVVTMTASHIGNTGVNGEDPESDKVWVSGFVVRELSEEPSSWRSEGSLAAYLSENGVPGIQGVDTRALVRHLRDRGAMKCAVSTDGASLEALQQQIDGWPGMEGRALATEVGCKEAWVANNPASPTVRLAVLDGGCKRNIVRLLADAGAYVRVHPITDPADAFLEDVDGVLVSNGPGDPAALDGVVETLRGALGRKPMVGICLGAQLLGLACGGTTYKLKFGHRGANQPVRDERSGSVEITSQNHGFALERASLEAAGATVTHVHLNDESVSGFAHADHRVFAVQYHPEASPGPHDGQPLIQEFVRFVTGGST